jgi:hypothetical protein
MTKMSRILFQLALAGHLILGTAAMAADSHSHDAGHGSAIQLKLDHGKQWPTDEPLRAGMTGIRSAVAGSLDRIHAGAFSASQYDTLAGQVENHVDSITKTCHLAEEADAQLHVVLVRIIDGVDGMRGKGGARSDGVVKVVDALNAYGKHFDHRGWSPIPH